MGSEALVERLQGKEREPQDIEQSIVGRDTPRNPYSHPSTLILFASVGVSTGAAPVMLGVVLLVIALLPDHLRQIPLATIPGATLGILLLIASVALGASRRLIDALPSRRPVSAVTALGTFFGNPMIGLILGTLGEFSRKRVVFRVKGSLG